MEPVPWQVGRLPWLKAVPEAPKPVLVGVLFVDPKAPPEPKPPAVVEPPPKLGVVVFPKRLPPPALVLAAVPKAPPVPVFAEPKPPPDPNPPVPVEVFPPKIPPLLGVLVDPKPPDVVLFC